MSDITIREILTDAIRFWERARPIYNAVLAVIVLGFFLAGLPQSKEALSLDWFLQLFMGAVMANFFYCAAYIPDVCVQLSNLREKWLRLRWGLFAIGLGFAAVWTRFISQEGLFKAGN